MRFSAITSPLALMATSLLLAPSVTAGILKTNSLNACAGSDNSGFTATLFDVAYDSETQMVGYNISAASSIGEKVIANLEVIAYGLVIINKTINPCNNDKLIQLCPLNPGPFLLRSTSDLSSSAGSIKIPAIAFGVPDLDGTVRAYINDAKTGKQLACVEAELSNGKTVDQDAVKWVTAIVSGIALLVSAVTSGLGHSNTAAHVASNALSLFGFFQSQALIGMTAVRLPPMVQSWTQNFQWSMGMVRIGFMQSVCTWYQRSTGGVPSTIISNLINVSVEVQKRSIDVANRMVSRGVSPIAKRASTTIVKQTIVVGIQRVGFRAGIEPTNIFLTGLGVFVAFVVIVTICVACFKGACELAAKQGWMSGEKFQDFRNGWKIVLKGILFRIVLIGYTQMSVLCLWELTQRDSAAEVVIAIFYWLAMTAALLWAAFKVVRIAKRSVSLHKNPAYILYSDPTALNKWGFLYVQYRATAYYYILPQLAYILLKAIFVAFAQGAPVAQAVGLLIIEAAWLIGVSIIRPWMDKRTNGFNISISAVGFLSTIFLLIFTNVFNQPGIVSGVIGVVFFVINAVFAFILLIMVVVSSFFAIFSKNPDTRYQPMRDDRGSFIKSGTNLNTELDALGATARGEKGMKRDLDDDSDSFSSAPPSRLDPAGIPLPSSAAASSRGPNDFPPGPPSPIDPSTPFIPNNGAPRHQAPGAFGQPPMSQRSNDAQSARSLNAASPAPRFGAQPSYGNGGGYDRSGSMNSTTPSYKPYNGGGYGNQGAAPPQGGSQWQRGAGYDH